MPNTLEKKILYSLNEAEKSLQMLMTDSETIAKISKVATELAHCLQNNGRAFSCGNGGSMSDAMHFAEELSGRFRKDRSPLPATAISDSGHITCVANDFGYEKIFSRYLEAHANEGDFLLAISTSGTSANIIKALKIANSKKMFSVALTGIPDSNAGKLASLELATPSASSQNKYSDRVQELNIKVIHIIIELTERLIFPQLYK